MVEKTFILMLPSLYHLHHCTTFITVPPPSLYHLHHCTTSIIVPPPSLYHLHHCTTSITVPPPSLYHLHHCTTSIIVPPPSLYHLHHCTLPWLSEHTHLLSQLLYKLEYTLFCLVDFKEGDQTYLYGRGTRHNCKEGGLRITVRKGD